MSFTDEMTLRDARDELRELVDDGCRCPCCTQFAKVYRRKIHASMARVLIAMYRAVPAGEWVYLPDVPQKSRDATGMAWWGLIEEEIELLRDDGGRAGWWRVTELGRRFVRYEIAVRKYALVYDGRRLKLDGEAVTIVDCLGDKFDYRELMDGL